MKALALTICFSLTLIGFSGVSAHKARPGGRIAVPRDLTARASLEGGNVPVSAVSDTFWFGPWDFELGDGTCMHDNPAQPLGLPGSVASQFWTSTDERVQPVYWHRTDGGPQDPGLVLEGSYSMWCGWVDVCGEPTYVRASGYRNRESQQLYRTFRLGADPGNITYKYYADSEPGYDFVYLIASRSHDCEQCRDVVGDTLVVYSGKIGQGVESVSLAAFANDTITLVFEFKSDLSWSDEDGLYSTGGVGPFVVDSIAVETDAGVLDYTDFESSSGSWQACAAAYGDYAAIRSLASLEVLDPICPCLNGCVLAFYDPSSTPHEQVAGLADIAVSPTVHLTRDPNWPRGGSVLQFAWYRNLPLFADNFAVWHVRYGPVEDGQCGLCDEWSQWYDRNTVYYSPAPSCGVSDFDLAGLVPVHAESVQVAVGVVNRCLLWPSWCVQPGNESPLFDNIRFGTYGGRAPMPFISDWDFFQDSFATDGTLSPRSTGRIDSGANIYPTDPDGWQRHTVLGDTLVCGVSKGCPSTNPRAIQNPDAVVNLLFRVSPGPCIDQQAFDAWYSSFPTNGSWRYARMDTARSVDPGSPTVAGLYMSRFHESDLHYNPDGDNDILPDNFFTPGTTIEYFLEAHWVETPGVSAVYPDTCGGTYQEAEVLPDVANTGLDCDGDIGPGDQNCLLYVDRFEELAAQGLIERGFSALGLGPVTEGNNGWPDLQQWDRYDNEGPGWEGGNSLGGRTCQDDLTHPDGPRVVGPTLTQLLNYKAIFWNAGDLREGTFASRLQYDCADDIGLLEAWLDYPRPDSVLLWVEGNKIAEDLCFWGGPSSASFAARYLGIDIVATSYRDYTGDYGDCPDLDGVSGSWAENRHCGLEQSAITTCGLDQRDFNVLTTSPTTQASQGVLRYGVQLSPDEFASVSHDAMRDTATLSRYKTVTDAFSLDCLRKYQPYCDSDVCIAWWEADVLGGGFFDYCWGNLGAVGIDGASPAELHVNRLAYSCPNPMNPGTSIEFSLREAGRVRLRVFDVSGRLVVTLLDRVMSRGSHRVTWDGTNGRGRRLASGVYFYQIEAKGFKDSKKLIVLR